MKSRTQKLHFGEGEPSTKNKPQTLSPAKLPPHAHQLPAEELTKLFWRGELGNKSRRRPADHHRKWNDPRLAQLPHHYFLNKEVMDVGCGDGALAIQLAIKYFPGRLTGVDVDARLIELCRKNLDKFARPEQELGLFGRAQREAQLTVNHLFAAQINQILNAVQQLPECFITRLKSPDPNRPNPPVFELKIPPQLGCHQQKILNRFPENLTFACGSIFHISPDTYQYDTITCLSLTKHLQLTFGDEAILDLFRHLYCLLRNGGHLILQAQPWSSYRKDRNDYAIYDQNYPKIEIRPSQYRQQLEALGFRLLEEFKFSPQHQKLNKPLSIYIKQ